jgi:serine/threonine protein kinase
MIAGRYTPLEPARSGLPQRARDQQTAQSVWLRDVPLPEGERGAAAAARARSARGLIYPSLVALFDVTEVAADRLLLAYEFVPAQSIKQLSGGQPLNPRRAAELMSEVADGVAALHARGIAHGAITTDTVLVTMKGKAKLDRLADPSLVVHHPLDEKADVRDIIAVICELTEGTRGTLPSLDRFLQRNDGLAKGSAAALAASLRRMAART